MIKKGKGSIHPSLPTSYSMDVHIKCACFSSRHALMLGLFSSSINCEMPAPRLRWVMTTPDVSSRRAKREGGHSGANQTR